MVQRTHPWPSKAAYILYHGVKRVEGNQRQRLHAYALLAAAWLEAQVGPLPAAVVVVLKRVQRTWRVCQLLQGHGSPPERWGTPGNTMHRQGLT